MLLNAELLRNETSPLPDMRLKYPSLLRFVLEVNVSAAKASTSYGVKLAGMPSVRLEGVAGVKLDGVATGSSSVSSGS
jgi:hypothetical protein